MPFVLALMLGLVMSLVQSFDCCAAFADTGTSLASMNANGDASPDGPDRQMPAHACHCLCHIAAQTAATLSLPADIASRAPIFARQQSPVSLAGLPLFKPPRA
ncbi:MAG: ferrichrome ABC transporter substrate-binding protein [Tardiphaga sp.]